MTNDILSTHCKDHTMEDNFKTRHEDDITEENSKTRTKRKVET